MLMMNKIKVFFCTESHLSFDRDWKSESICVDSNHNTLGYIPNVIWLPIASIPVITCPIDKQFVFQPMRTDSYHSVPVQVEWSFQESESNALGVSKEMIFGRTDIRI